MSREEFAEEFPSEGQFIEWKAGLSRTPIQESVVAFSNAEGGVILIGVEDDGRVTGRELTASVESTIHEILATVRDPGAYDVLPVLAGDVPVTVLCVGKRVEGIAQTSSGRPLVRRGSRNAPLFGADLLELLRARTRRRFEEEDSGVGLAVASRDLLQRLAGAYGWDDATLELLVDQHFVIAGGDNLTVAGALHLLERPDTSLGRAFIEILRFREGESAYDRRVEIFGPASDQIEQATDFVSEQLGTELVVLGLRRHEFPRIPKPVLREAIANAVAHRSYESSRAAIRVEIHPDRVLVESPGPLPEPVTVKNIRDTNAARNPTVIAVLRRLGLAEDIGRGVDVMEDSMREELLDPPVFIDTGHSVQVHLPTRSAVTPLERAWVRELETRGKLEPDDRLLLVHAARGEALMNSRARELLHRDSTEARRALQRLCDAGLLLRHGERGGAAYTLAPTLAPPAGLRLAQRELDELVLELARDGPVTNSRVRAVTGLDRSDALRVLERLVQAGRLKRRGERRGAHYVLDD